MGRYPAPGNLPTPFHLANALSETDIHQDSPTPIMIVLGNPPYAGHSANREAWMLSLLDEYKVGWPELKRRAQAKWLSDDYVKIVALLTETIHLMRDIDCVIEQAGGWPF
jgi:hypothetical protein